MEERKKMEIVMNDPFSEFKAKVSYLYFDAEDKSCMSYKLTTSLLNC